MIGCDLYVDCPQRQKDCQTGEITYCIYRPRIRYEEGRCIKELEPIVQEVREQIERGGI